MHVELPWWQRQHALLFGKVERLSEVSWHDVGMHAVLKYTDLEDLVSKNASLSIWQYFRVKQEKISLLKQTHNSLRE